MQYFQNLYNYKTFNYTYEIILLAQYISTKFDALSLRRKY